MTIREIFQDGDSLQVPYDNPRFELFVGGSTQSVTNPTIIAWVGVNLNVLSGPDYDSFSIKKASDPRKVGTYTRFLGTFTTPNEPNDYPLGIPQYPLTKIATVELSGDLNRWRPKLQRNWDGFIYAPQSYSGENSKWFGVSFGNYTRSTNPTPIPPFIPGT